MITVKNLRFTYPGAVEEVLRGLDFTVERGEIFGFLGPSGSGKSTTQKILYRLLTGYDGTVTVDGSDLSGLGRAYFHQIGVGFELPNHYLKLSGRENLKLFSQFYRPEKLREMDELFDRVGLLPDADRKVEGYSKGMKMRLNFIRALLHDPDILFFDEPTSGMDPGNAMRIKELILELREQGKAIFITTHNMFTADQLCDRVAFIDKGNLVAMDSPKQFKLDHGKHRVRVELVGEKIGAAHEYAVEGIGENGDFLNLIRENEVKTIHTMEATLEEVFLKLTGKELN